MGFSAGEKAVGIGPRLAGAAAAAAGSCPAALIRIPPIAPSDGVYSEDGRNPIAGWSRASLGADSNGSINGGSAAAPPRLREALP